MKFDCGPTYQERITAKKEWHRWFALLPRRVGSNDCRWLEYIERKGETYMGYTPAAPFPITKWCYEYRVKEDAA